MFAKRCLSLVMVAFLAQPQLLVCANGLEDQEDTQLTVDTHDKAIVDLDEVDTNPDASSKQKKEIKIDVKVNEDGSASFGFTTGNRNIDILLLLFLAVGGTAWKMGYFSGHNPQA